MFLFFIRFSFGLSWSGESPVICCEPKDTKDAPSRRVSFPRQCSLIPCCPPTLPSLLSWPASSSCSPFLTLPLVFSSNCSHSLNSPFSNSLMLPSPFSTLFYNSLSLLIFFHSFPLHILSLHPSPSLLCPHYFVPFFSSLSLSLLLSLTFPLSITLSPFPRLSAPCLTALLVSCSLLARWSSSFPLWPFSFVFLGGLFCVFVSCLSLALVLSGFLFVYTCHSFFKYRLISFVRLSFYFSVYLFVSVSFELFSLTLSIHPLIPCLSSSLIP